MIFYFSLLVLFGAVLFAGFFMYRWQIDKAGQQLVEWARQEGLQILSKEDASSFSAGAASKMDKRQTFKIRVRDKDGAEKSGTVVVGTKNMGVTTHSVDVSWDEP